MFAGAATTVGAWIALQLLGAGIGLASVDTSQGSNLRAVGIGTGLWSVIAPLIALFLGALTGARLAGTHDRRIGALHGVVMWGLTSAIGIMFVMSIVGAVATGVAKVGSTAASTAGTAVAGVVPQAANAAPDVAQALGIDSNDLVAPINNELQQQGKPPVTSTQVAAIARGVAQRGFHDGKLDRTVLVDEIAANTQLTRADAEDVANRFGDRYQQAMTSAQQRVDRFEQQTKHAALRATDATGKAMLWGGIALIVGLLASVLGGAIGVPRLRDLEVPPTAESVVVTAPPV